MEQMVVGGGAVTRVRGGGDGRGGGREVVRPGWVW